MDTIELLGIVVGYLVEGEAEPFSSLERGPVESCPPVGWECGVRAPEVAHGHSVKGLSRSRMGCGVVGIPWV